MITFVTTFLVLVRKKTRFTFCLKKSKMKYNNQKKIGHYCGYRLGLQLESFSSFKVIDAVIPVPLHPKRERKRGYNQVFAFAQSLANCLNAQFYPTALKRIRHTPYLAQATAEERHQIIANAFELHPAMHNSRFC